MDLFQWYDQTDVTDYPPTLESHEIPMSIRVRIKHSIRSDVEYMAEQCDISVEEKLFEYEHEWLQLTGSAANVNRFLSVFYDEYLHEAS